MHRSFCRRRVETVRTHYGVLDIPTIDASNCHTQIACFRTQAIECFTDEQSPAALAKHRSSFYLSLIGEPHVGAWHRLRRQAAPASAIVSGVPSTFRTRPWTERMPGRGAAPGLSRCSTPPDPLNHIQSRMPNLYGEDLGPIDPLGKSRYHLLVSDRLRVCMTAYREARRQSAHNCSCWET